MSDAGVELAPGATAFTHSSVAAAQAVAHAATGRRYLEFLRERSLSSGLYVLPPGAADPQSPHREDEVYVVLRGRARFTAGGGTVEVSAGSVLYVAAGLEHRFADVEEELHVVVLFAPPESGP